jgi:hypothetical protein
MYRKFFVAFAGWVAVALASVLTDGHITTEEWIQFVIQLTTTVGVWAAANVPTLTWAKALIAGVLAAANLAISLITDGLTGPELLNLVIAGLTAAGVWTVSNTAPAPADGGV